VLLFAFGSLNPFGGYAYRTNNGAVLWIQFKGAKSKRRDEIADFARSYFGEFCGYAQEYLYLENRE